MLVLLTLQAAANRMIQPLAPIAVLLPPVRLEWYLVLVNRLLVGIVPIKALRRLLGSLIHLLRALNIQDAIFYECQL